MFKNLFKKSIPAKQLRWCSFINVILLILCVIVIVLFGDPSQKYLHIGPSDDVYLLGICINTMTKYGLTLLFLSMLKIAEIVVGEIAQPILWFNIYNIDKKVITEFSKFELQLHANIIYATDTLRYTLLILISITQIDIAVFTCLAGQFATLFTARYLLRDKKFVDSLPSDPNDIESRISKY